MVMIVQWKLQNASKWFILKQARGSIRSKASSLTVFLNQTHASSLINLSFLVSLTFVLLLVRLVLSDAELEESLENLPLLIAKVDMEHWIRV